MNIVDNFDSNLLSGCVCSPLLLSALSGLSALVKELILEAHHEVFTIFEPSSPSQQMLDWKAIKSPGV